MFRSVLSKGQTLARTANINFIPRNGMSETTTPLSNYVLKVEQIDDNRFRSGATYEVSRSPRRYGGQMMGEAMLAASQVVNNPKLMLKSFQCYFIRPVPVNTPQSYEVRVDRTSGVHHSAHCTVRSYSAPDKLSFILMSSFGLSESPSSGQKHHIKMPDVPRPDQLQTISEMELVGIMQMAPMEKKVAKRTTMEWKLIDEQQFRIDINHKERCRQTWFRVPATFLPKGDVCIDMHGAAVVYMLDVVAVMTVRMTAPPPPELNLRVASLDHSMWFHKPFRADEWLFLQMTNDKAAAARGLVEGSIWNMDGELVSSFAQEGIFRDANPET